MLRKSAISFRGYAYVLTYCLVKQPVCRFSRTGSTCTRGVNSSYAERKRGIRCAAFAVQRLGDAEAALRRVVQRRRVHVGKRHAPGYGRVDGVVGLELAVLSHAVARVLLVRGDVLRREDILPVALVGEAGGGHGLVDTRALEHGRHRVHLVRVGQLARHVGERLDLDQHVRGACVAHVVRGAVLDRAAVLVLRYAVAAGHVLLDAEEQRPVQAGRRQLALERDLPGGVRPRQPLLGAGERVAARHGAAQRGDDGAVVGERRDGKRELVLGGLAPLDGLGHVDAGVVAVRLVGVDELGALGARRRRRVAVAVADSRLVHAVVVSVRDLDGDGPAVGVIRHAGVRVGRVLGDVEGVGALLVEREARAGHLLKPDLAGVLGLLLAVDVVHLRAVFQPGVGAVGHVGGVFLDLARRRVPRHRQARDGAVLDGLRGGLVGRQDEAVLLVYHKAVPGAAHEVLVRLDVGRGRRGVVGVGEHGGDRLAVVLRAQRAHRPGRGVHLVVRGAHRDARALRAARHHQVVLGVVVGHGRTVTINLDHLVHVRAAQAVCAQVAVGHRVRDGAKEHGRLVVSRDRVVARRRAQGVDRVARRHGDVPAGDVGEGLQVVERGEAPRDGGAAGAGGRVLAAHGGEREEERALGQRVIALVLLRGSGLDDLLCLVVHVGEGGKLGLGVVAVAGDVLANLVLLLGVGDALHHEAPGRHLLAVHRPGLVGHRHGHAVLGEGVRDTRDAALRLGDVVRVGARFAVGDVPEQDALGTLRVVRHGGFRRTVHRRLDVGRRAPGRHGAVGHGGVGRVVVTRKRRQADGEHVVFRPRARRVVARERLACQELLARGVQRRRSGLVAVREDQLAVRVDAGGVLDGTDDARHGVVGLLRVGIRRAVEVGALRQVEALRRVGVGVLLRHHASLGRGTHDAVADLARVGVAGIAGRVASARRALGPGVALCPARAVHRVRVVLGRHARRRPLQRRPLGGRQVRVVVEFRHRALRARLQAVHPQPLVRLECHDVAGLHRQVADQLLGRDLGAVLARRHGALVDGRAVRLVGRELRAARVLQRQLEEELRVGDGLLRGIVVGGVQVLHLLGHLHAGHATVLDANAHGGREQLVHLEVAQVGALAGRAVLEKRHAVPAGVEHHDGKLAVLGHVLQHRAVRLRAVLHVHGHGLGALGCGGRVPHHLRTVLAQRAGLLVALDEGQRVVDVVVGAKLVQQGHQRAGARQRPHAVVLLAGVGIHAVLLHDHLHPLVAHGVTGGRLRLLQVVHALGQGRALVALHREAHGPGQVVQAVRAARSARVHRVRVGLDTGHVAVGVKVQRACRVQRELGAVHGVAGLVHLLHPQAVLDVGDAQARGEVAVKADTLHRERVVLGGAGQGRGGRVVEVHLVLGRVRRRHAVVGADVARHGGDVRGDLAGRRVGHKPVGARRPARRGLRRRNGAGEVRASKNLVPHGGSAHDRLPHTAVRLREHHREQRAGRGGGYDGAAVRECQRFRGDDPLHRRKVAAVQPLAADLDQVAARVRDGLVGRDKHATVAIGHLDVLKMQLLVAARGTRGVVEARTVAARHRHLAQDKVRGTGRRRLVERDDVPVGVLQGQLAVGVRGAGGDGVALHGIALVGAVQRKRRAGHGAVVLVVLGDVRGGSSVEVRHELQVGRTRAALQEEELHLVLRVGLERVAAVVEVLRGRVLAERSLVERAQGGGFVRRRACAWVKHAGPVGDGHLAGREVDAQAARVVNTAHVTHQHAIDVQPHVVVADKVEHHVATVDLAVLRLRELRGH